MEREIEDLQALVGVLGGSAAMYGTSSGAVLAARATAAGIGVAQLALYEPPLALDGMHQPQPADFIAQIAGHIARGAHGEATKVFMKSVGVPAFGIAMMRIIPGVWRNMITVAPTVMHDFAVLGDTQRGGPMPTELLQVLAKVQVPTTVMAGGKSPPWMHHAMHAVAAAVPGAQTRVVPGQDHNAAARPIAAALRHVLAARDGAHAAA